MFVDYVGSGVGCCRVPGFLKVAIALHFIIGLCWFKRPFGETMIALVVPALVGAAFFVACCLFREGGSLRKAGRYLRYLGVFIPSALILIARAPIFHSYEINLTMVVAVPLAIAGVVYCVKGVRWQCVALAVMTAFAMQFAGMEGSAAGAIVALVTGISVLLFSVCRTADNVGKVWVLVSVVVVAAVFLLLVTKEETGLREAFNTPRYYLWHENEEIEMATKRAVYLAKLLGSSHFAYDTDYFGKQLFTLMLCKLGWIPTILVLLFFVGVLAFWAWSAIDSGDPIAIAAMVVMVLQTIAYALFCFGVVDLLFPAELPFFGGVGANVIWVLLAVWILLPPERRDREEVFLDVIDDLQQ